MFRVDLNGDLGAALCLEKKGFALRRWTFLPFVFPRLLWTFWIAILFFGFTFILNVSRIFGVAFMER